MESSPSTPRTAAPQVRVTDDLDLLLAVMPRRVRQALGGHPELDRLLEVVLDLGRPPEARFPERGEELAAEPVSGDELAGVVERVGRFGDDNRAGIARTLHRISAIRNRQGTVVGLTCRVGRALFGTIDIVRDVVESGRSILLLGRPGVGKTTLLREAARVLADDLGKRVVVVDTSNEIAGDADVPHPGIGRARRMQVPSPDRQHAVMIEAVENHMPEVVVIDEIGTHAETLAARTIAERGVQLIATAHGNALDNLVQNPTLADLVGGVQPVILSDEEARRRRTRKTVLERKAPPTFDMLVEIREKDRFAVHRDVDRTVDAMLRGFELEPEIRTRRPDGELEIRPPEPAQAERAGRPAERPVLRPPWSAQRPLRIFPFAVSRSKLERAIRDSGLPARMVDHLGDADVVLTVKAQDRRQPRRLREATMRGVRVEVVRSNTVNQLTGFLRSEFAVVGGPDDAGLALEELDQAVDRALDEGHPVELAPRDRRIRRLQHERIGQLGLTSESKGDEPYRRVIVYPG